MSNDKVKDCKELVADAMGGATLTPDEQNFVDVSCGKGNFPLSVALRLKFNRALAELEALIVKEALQGDEEIMATAFDLLATMIEPKVALNRAKSTVDLRRKSPQEAQNSLISKLAEKKKRKQIQKSNEDGPPV